jgi:hypothetical protein
LRRTGQRFPRDNWDMNYICDLGNGRQLRLENDGNQTHLGLGSSDSGQQQSQSVGFQTGEWSSEPAVFKQGNDLIIQLHLDQGERYFRARRGAVEAIDDAPDLAKAERLSLKESSADSGLKPMKPMEPMKPMKPMEPMKPMR